MKDSYFESSFAKNCKYHWNFIKNFEDKERWEILAEQYEEKKSYSESSINLVPKKIHQIWIGPKKLPRKYKEWMKSWQYFHKDWEYKLWTDEDIKDIKFHNKKIYDSSNNIGFKSDILRYEILYKYGGIYIDTDLECVKKIPNYFREYEFISCIVFNKTPQINNALIISKPRANLISKMVKSIKIQKNDTSALETLSCSGANLLTKQYFSLTIKERSENLILPSDYFYPLPNFLVNTKITKKDFLTDKTIGIHYWEVSWMKGNFIKRVINKLVRIIKILIFFSERK